MNDQLARSKKPSQGSNRFLRRRILSRSSVAIIGFAGVAISLESVVRLAIERFAGIPCECAPSFQVDLESADADTIALLPGIGPALAARIVEDRSRLGRFHGLSGLQRVRGIGPAISAEVAPFVLTHADDR